eukprot:3447288-Rhodomonas_salina.1
MGWGRSRCHRFPHHAVLPDTDKVVASELQTFLSSAARLWHSAARRVLALGPDRHGLSDRAPGGQGTLFAGSEGAEAGADGVLGAEALYLLSRCAP